MGKNEKYCSVCGNTFDAFLPLWPELANKLAQVEALYGPIPYELEFRNREEILCPLCGALDRERLVATYLLKRLGKGFIKPDFKVIEFAPRKHLTEFLKRNFTFDHKTADLFMPEVDYQIDISHMPEIESQSVDMWISLHVLEHVPEDKVAYKELHRILKKDGFGVFLVPVALKMKETDEDPNATLEERWKRFGQDDHIRLYAKNHMVQRIEEAGFTVHQFGQNYFTELVYKRQGLPRKACLYILEAKK